MVWQNIWRRVLSWVLINISPSNTFPTMHLLGRFCQNCQVAFGHIFNYHNDLICWNRSIQFIQSTIVTLHIGILPIVTLWHHHISSYVKEMNQSADMDRFHRLGNIYWSCFWDFAEFYKQCTMDFAWCINSKLLIHIGATNVTIKYPWYPINFS